MQPMISRKLFGFVVLQILTVLLWQSLAVAAQLRLNWSDNSTNENGFEIERRTSTTTFTRIATVASNILQTMNEALVVLGTRRNIEFVNKKTQELFGYLEEDLVGAGIERLIPRPEVFQQFDEQVLKTLQGKASITAIESEITTADGNTIPVHVNASVVKDERGKPTGTILVLSDIRQLKAHDEKIRSLNQELQKRVMELAASNRELEAFSYSVSHDLVAPLRSIDGFSQILLEDYLDRLDEQGKDYLNRVRAASRRMEELIHDLLDLARVSRSKLSHQPISLSALALSVAEELRKTRPDRKIEFVIQEGLTATGDEHLLLLVLENLLGNAWKYTLKRSGARIEFGALKDKPRGLLEVLESRGEETTVYFVRDNGAGFDMAYADKLFLPFQRLHSEKEFEGNGIGLATVQRIIERHGGRVWAEGEVGRGAEFYFTL